MPLLEDEVDKSVPFSPDEKLYRRVLPYEELTDGEIDPTRLSSISFDKDVKGSPSVLRGRYAKATDALHKDCVGQKDVTGQYVYRITVDALPKTIASEDKKEYDVFPLHHPLVKCGAHSVISCCRKGDATKTYARPSRSARNDLRTKLAANLRKVTPEEQAAEQHPSAQN